MQLSCNHILEESGLEIPTKILIYFEPEINDQGIVSKRLDVNFDVPSETINRYLQVKRLIGHCASNAELINDQLRDLLLKILPKSAQEEIYKMEFMGLRGLFSVFLHNYTAIKRQENFNTKPKRKLITKTLYDFILDRNIYTHGILKIRQPNTGYIIDYVEGPNKVQAEINVEILKSFIETYSLLHTTLNKIQQFYNDN